MTWPTVPARAEGQKGIRDIDGTYRLTRFLKVKFLTSDIHLVSPWLLTFALYVLSTSSSDSARGLCLSSFLSLGLLRHWYWQCPAFSCDYVWYWDSLCNTSSDPLNQAFSVRAFLSLKQMTAPCCQTPPWDMRLGWEGGKPQEPWYEILSLSEINSKNFVPQFFP